ncbi:hypothetical protein SDC9_184607 [bioreactor metagenome]|uniref:Uncharacterized protein n=1 Tax=bioreactor metagenome TaxID=1076179 RepID=A0A645HDJ7_9ZZZZ
MVSCAAGYDVDPAVGFQLFLGQFQLIQSNRVAGLNPAGHGIAQRFGLLMNFLQGKMVISAFFSQFRSPGNFMNILRERIEIIIIEVHGIGVQHGDFLIIQINDLFGVFQNRRDITGNEPFFVTNSDNERGILADGNQLAWLAL